MIDIESKNDSRLQKVKEYWTGVRRKIVLQFQRGILDSKEAVAHLSDTGFTEEEATKILWES
jgi:hypothetical protein